VLLLLVVRIVVRSALATTVVFVLIAAAVGAVGGAPFGAFNLGISSLIAAIALTRYGLLTLVTSTFVSYLLIQARAAIAQSPGSGIVVFVMMGVLAAAAVWLAIGRPALMPRARANVA
jgi:hypothetical protein